MDSFTAYVLEQLSALDIEERRMFGSHGLYLEDRFFAIISDGALYFKTDEESRKKYGTQPFAPSKEQVLKNYYEVPGRVLEDEETLEEWALEAAQK